MIPFNFARLSAAIPEKGGILGCALLFSVSAFWLVSAVRPIRWEMIGADGASQYIRQVETLMRRVPPEVAELGYLSDPGVHPGPWADRSPRFSHLCLAQFAAVPRVLHDEPQGRWVVSQPDDKGTALRYYERYGYRMMLKQPGRLVLLYRPSEKDPVIPRKRPPHFVSTKSVSSGHQVSHQDAPARRPR